MSSKKGGLADLKRLAREAAQAGGSPAAASPPASVPVARVPAASSPEPAADDRALFRRMAGPVAPVDTRNRLLHTPATRPAAPTLPLRTATASDTARRRAPTLAPTRPDHGISDGDVSHLLRDEGTAFLRNGMGDAVLKKLRARGWRIGADLDLHGMTVEQARGRFADFILQCVAYDVRCIRVVHGKGYNSPGGNAVLRERVQSWLVGSAQVRAFVEAPERDGGAGAILALLSVEDRRGRDRRAPSKGDPERFD